MLLEYSTFGKSKEQNVTSMVDQFVKLTLKQRCVQLKHLMGLFGRSGTRLHLLRILRQSLKKNLEDSEEQSEVQSEYHRAGTTSLALGMLK